MGAFAARNTRAVHALRYRCRRTARLARWLAGDAALADTHVAGYCGQVPTTTALFLAGMVMQVIHARVARSFLSWLAFFADGCLFPSFCAVPVTTLRLTTSLSLLSLPPRGTP